MRLRKILFRNILVIGLGEIGAPLLEIVKGTYNAQGLDIEVREITESIDLIHICYPYSENFIQTSIDYIKRFNNTQITGLKNVTDTTYKYGNASYAGSSSLINAYACLSVEISDTKTFEVEHYTQIASTTNTFGIPINISLPEIYTIVKITQLK